MAILASGNQCELPVPCLALLCAGVTVGVCVCVCVCGVHLVLLCPAVECSALARPARHGRPASPVCLLVLSLESKPKICARDAILISETSLLLPFVEFKGLFI